MLRGPGCAKGDYLLTPTSALELSTTDCDLFDGWLNFFDRQGHDGQTGMEHTQRAAVDPPKSCRQILELPLSCGSTGMTKSPPKQILLLDQDPDWCRHAMERQNLHETDALNGPIENTAPLPSSPWILLLNVLHSCFYHQVLTPGTRPGLWRLVARDGQPEHQCVACLLRHQILRVPRTRWPASA